jgi:hypothetical protein
MADEKESKKVEPKQKAQDINDPALVKARQEAAAKRRPAKAND